MAGANFMFIKIFCVFLICVLITTSSNCYGNFSPNDQNLTKIKQKIAAAQKKQNEKEVVYWTNQAIDLLGEKAGVPETPDRIRSVPTKPKLLSDKKIKNAFDPYLKEIIKRKWWEIGLDPTKTEKMPREVANIITGCTAVIRANLNGAEQCHQIAKSGADYLIWTQKEAGTGVYPFHALRNGRGLPFKVAEKALKKAEKNGTIKQMVKNDWIIEDFDEGGLQFDNGLCGVAMLEFYKLSKDQKYLDSAKKAAGWAIKRDVVPNWNYNSFSIFLLAETFRVTKDKKYIESAKKKARLGLYPGQFKKGKYKGCWADGHNARPEYHYIIVRGLVSLVSQLNKTDRDYKLASNSLKLALKARNQYIADGKILAPDSSLEALTRLNLKLPRFKNLCEECFVNESFENLSKFVDTEFSSNKFPVSPATWGLYLEELSKNINKNN